MSIFEHPPRPARRARSDVLARSARGARRDFQIGPRIRIGGSIGKAGQKLKEGVGKVLSNKIVDTGLALIPGVGPGIAAAANAAGHVLDTSNGGIHSLGDVGHVALDAGEAYLGGKAANAIKGGLTNAIGTLGAKVPISAAGDVASGSPGTVSIGGITIPAPQAAALPDGASSGGGLLDTLKGLFSGGGSDGQGNFGLLGDLGGKLLGGDGGTGSGTSALDKLLLLASVADTAKTRADQQHLRDEGLGYAKDAYAAKAPLRAQGLTLLQQQTSPDLSFVANPANPYTRTPAVGDVGPKVPILPTGGTY